VIEEVGVQQIRERSLGLTTLLIELLDETGFPVGSPRDPARRGGTVSVKPPGHERVGRGLLERRVIIDWRPDVGLRLGPHFFNTEDELRFAVDQIVELAGAQSTSLRA
jgi:kynureninase